MDSIPALHASHRRPACKQNPRSLRRNSRPSKRLARLFLSLGNKPFRLTFSRCCFFWQTFEFRNARKKPRSPLMGNPLRQVEAESKFCHSLTVEALERAVPLDTIKSVLQQQGVQTQRERKLNMVVTVWVIIAINRYAHLLIGHVMRKLARGLRFIWPDPNYRLPKASALTYRRYQLGARPLAALFRRLCRPMATPQTPGAFRFGLRLMAIDGTVEDLPDTPENVAVFGRHHSDRGQAAFPQLQSVYLAECGTHAIVDAGFWPCHTCERVGGFRGLRSVTNEMFVMWDRGLHDFDMFLEVRQRNAHALGRLPAHVKPQVVERLADDSLLAYLYPSDPARRKRGEHLVVRLV